MLKFDTFPPTKIADFNLIENSEEKKFKYCNYTKIFPNIHKFCSSNRNIVASLVLLKQLFGWKFQNQTWYTILVQNQPTLITYNVSFNKL